jgi:hypothetical protein
LEEFETKFEREEIVDIVKVWKKTWFSFSKVLW